MVQSKTFLLQWCHQQELLTKWCEATPDSPSFVKIRFYWTNPFLNSTWIRSFGAPDGPRNRGSHRQEGAALDHDDDGALLAEAEENLVPIEKGQIDPFVVMRKQSQKSRGDRRFPLRSAGVWWMLCYPSSCAAIKSSAAAAAAVSTAPSSATAAALWQSLRPEDAIGASSRDRISEEGSIWKECPVLGLRGGNNSPKRKTKKAKSVGSSKSSKVTDPQDNSHEKNQSDGEEPSRKSKKKKKKKASEPPAIGDASSSNKDQINQVLKETDAAQALGDAIRARADILRRDDSLWTGMMGPMDPSLSSLAWSLGASDYTDRGSQTRATKGRSEDEDEDVEETTDEYAGGVEVAPGAVVASYFLKSHGGAHALQSLCSLLSAAAGLGALALSGGNSAAAADSSTRSVVALTLLRRSLVFALVKHVSGLLAAAWISALAIPDVGFVRARSWMQQLALDPVSQYCFYTSLILVWLPSATGKAAVDASGSTAWWQQYPFVTLLLLGPILLREVISTALVACDVLVLLSLSSGGSNNGGGGFSTSLLKVAAGMGNAGFSVLVTPKVWRNASASQRQQILAKLVQKCSLAFEVAVGALLVADALRGAAELLFAAQRPHVTSVVRRAVCANLYVQFLLTRRRKIRRLASQIRGGAAYVPGYVLDVLLDPKAAMGIENSDEMDVDPSRRTRRSTILAKRDSDEGLTWREYLWLALEQD
jgi:hypothetical protein